MSNDDNATGNVDAEGYAPGVPIDDSEDIEEEIVGLL